jgi:hypothetical protein
VALRQAAVDRLNGMLKPGDNLVLVLVLVLVLAGAGAGWCWCWCLASTRPT